eukprot:gene17171-22687_t
MSISNKACFGAGCYWGTEKFFKIDFGNKIAPGSIKHGAVGFMGPETAKKNPTYREVCSGTTQHVEVYDLEFNGDETTYENLVKHFFTFHDPTTKNRQGNDAGTQYASAIFYYDNKQKEIATRVKSELQSLVNSGKIRYQGKTVETDIIPATIFYPAHDEHQAYLDKNPGGYCNHAYRFKEWPN